MNQDHEWTAEELAELEDPETWDPVWLQRHPGVPEHRMRVAVTFSRTESDLVSRRAEQAGMMVPAFLKALALGQVSADIARTG